MQIISELLLVIGISEKSEEFIWFIAENTLCFKQRTWKMKRGKFADDAREPSESCAAACFDVQTKITKVPAKMNCDSAKQSLLNS